MVGGSVETFSSTSTVIEVPAVKIFVVPPSIEVPSTVCAAETSPIDWRRTWTSRGSKVSEPSAVTVSVQSLVPVPLSATLPESQTISSSISYQSSTETKICSASLPTSASSGVSTIISTTYNPLAGVHMMSAPESIIVCLPPPRTPPAARDWYGQ